MLQAQVVDPVVHLRHVHIDEELGERAAEGASSGVEGGVVEVLNDNLVVHQLGDGIAVVELQCPEVSQLRQQTTLLARPGRQLEPGFIEVQHLPIDVRPVVVPEMVPGAGGLKD